MKRILAAILTLLLALSLCACSTGKGASTGSALTWEEIEALADAQLAAEQAANEQAE